MALGMENKPAFQLQIKLEFSNYKSIHVGTGLLRRFDSKRSLTSYRCPITDSFCRVWATPFTVDEEFRNECYFNDRMKWEKQSTRTSLNSSMGYGWVIITSSSGDDRQWWQRWRQQIQVQRLCQWWKLRKINPCFRQRVEPGYQRRNNTRFKGTFHCDPYWEAKIFLVFICNPC